MKLTILFTFVCLLTSTAFSQDRPRGVMIPEEILEGFENDFPEAGPEKWQKLSQSLFVAKFRLKGFVQHAHYAEDGEWLYTDIEITEEYIPEPAMAHYQATYSQYGIVGTGLHDARGNSYYFIEIFRGGVKRKLKYDEEGNFIQ